MWWLLSQVAAAGAQLLARLRVVEAVAKFQAAGEALARMHASGTAPETQAAQVAIGEAASTLAAVAQALASSGAAAEQPAPPIVSALQGQGMHIFLILCLLNNIHGNTRWPEVFKGSCLSIDSNCVQMW